MSRIEDVCEAETLARTANVFGGWREWQRALPRCRWVRSGSAYASFDPVIRRQVERRAAKEAAGRAKAEAGA